MLGKNVGSNSLYAGILLILSGFAIMFTLAVEGLARVGFLLLFPFIVSSSPLAFIPFILIFSGIILLFISFPLNLNKEYNRENSIYREPEHEKEEKESHFGGFLMIGPIPVIFGNDKKMVYISIAIAIFIIALYLLFTIHLL